MEIYFIVILTSCLLSFITMVDIARSRFKNQWITIPLWVLAFAMPLFGAIIYFNMRRHIKAERRVFNPQFNR